jgi:hypothetical protein
MKLRIVLERALDAVEDAIDGIEACIESFG